MSDQFSFKFADDDLNRQLIVLLKKSSVRHTVASDGSIRYSAKDDELVGNELIPAIRDKQFKSWQILCCTSNWLERYKAYMTDHHIPFLEESMDGEVRFLLPRSYRPHSWRLENGDARQSRRSVAEAAD